MSLDLFKFTSNPGSPTTLLGGEAIGGYLSAMWVERYQDAGEFEIRATLSSGLKDFLPLETFISRPCTFEVMMVENHEVIDDNDLDPILIITGRSMFSLLDRRIAGIYQVRNGVNIQPAPYYVYSNYRSLQTVYMINEHINFSNDVNDRFDNIIATSSINDDVVVNTKNVRIESLLEAVKSVCGVDDQGFRTLRRSPFNVYGASDMTNFNIYKGIDKSATVIFSYERGDITRAHYLWTNKNYKTTMVVQGGRCVTYAEIATKTKMDRRMGFMDASDVEGRYPESPSVLVLSWINGDMQLRGFEQMANQKQLTMAQVDISPNTNYYYRRDYNLGDLVMLDGNFGAMQKMRVIEHVEIEDENGNSAHPTLVLPPS